MKNFKSNLIKLSSFVLMLIFCVVVCLFCFGKAKKLEVYSINQGELSLVEVWNVETHEGGGKARVQFINSVVKKLEKLHAGKIFLVRTIKPESLEAELENKTPDIVCFGFGVGKVLLPHLTEFDNSFDVRDELVESGTFSGKIFALPYIVSGYALISHSMENTNTICGKSEFVAPQNCGEQNLTFCESSFSAYKEFLNNKTVNLLGTARDVFRISNLNNIGRANDIINPISTYTDLVQYVGIINRSSLATEFVAELLSKKHQQELVDFSLFSSLNTKIYSSGIYKDMEDAIFECKVAKVFA